MAGAGRPPSLLVVSTSCAKSFDTVRCYHCYVLKLMQYECHKRQVEVTWSTTLSFVNRGIRQGGKVRAQSVNTRILFADLIVSSTLYAK